MKYKAIIETDDYKNFEFFEDGNGKYMVGKDATAENNEWIALYFIECEQEPCEDAVSRTWIREHLGMFLRGCRAERTYEEIAEDVEAYIDCAPPVTPKQKTGKWIYQYDEFGEWDGVIWYFRCSECGRKISLSANKMSSYNNGKDLGYLLEHYPYCHCGAKMEGEQNDQYSIRSNG